MKGYNFLEEAVLGVFERLRDRAEFERYESLARHRDRGRLIRSVERNTVDDREKTTKE